MASKSNIRSIRISDDMLELIERGQRLWAFFQALKELEEH